MSPAKLYADDSSSPAELELIIAACERYEADWNAGRSRPIENEVKMASAAIRPRLFRELLALEVELSRRAGQAVNVGEYVDRFPDSAAAVRDVFMGRTLPEVDPEATWPRPYEPTSAPPLGGYELVRTLGEGGQAKTYLARDRALQRLVVLKRYHGVASPGRRDAVLNEGRALARVRSPFVAPCYGVESRGDEIDLVVEYVPGRPLNELTADERADLPRCARLVEQVAEGLAEVHACGLLHRDIKPQNIILGDDSLPRLVDFGLAVPVASEALQDVSGSPRYMAPEQARGQGERVDTRTDVFGLGGVLYDLLTGQPPRDGTTLLEVLDQARGAAIVPPRRINPRIPRSLERICLKAMAADPKLRFPSADAMRLALRRYRLTGQVAPLFAATAVLLTLLGLIWAFWPRHARPLPDGPGRASAAEQTWNRRPSWLNRLGPNCG